MPWSTRFTEVSFQSPQDSCVVHSRHREDRVSTRETFVEIAQISSELLDLVMCDHLMVTVIRTT